MLSRIRITISPVPNFPYKKKTKKTHEHRVKLSSNFNVAFKVDLSYYINNTLSHLKDGLNKIK